MPIVRNNTHYWNTYTKLYNEFPSVASFSYQSSKRMSYFQRLHFECEYTKSVNGKVFFYTLTYNDKSIPKFFYGYDKETQKPLYHNCFSYEDIRYVTNGRLSKYLNRYFGSRLRYFCACESGEGGNEEHHVRGAGNNPHYHFIFFVQPIHDKNDKPVFDKYKVISTEDFESCLKRVWVGYDCWYPWQFAKFGSVQPGRFGAEVKDSRALKYVSKYCLKSVDEQDFLNGDLRILYYKECKSKGMDFNFWHSYYTQLRLSSVVYDKQEFWKEYGFDKYVACLRRNGRKAYTYPYNYYIEDYGSDELKVKLIEAAQWFDDVYTGLYINDSISYYINNFSPKVRCSKTLGIYGLNFINNIDSDPKFVISLPSGHQVVKPALFYIRHLYYDKVICPVTGNVLYRYNDLGKQYKMNSLSRLIDNVYNHTRENIARYHSNFSDIPKDSVGYYLKSDINRFVFRPDLDKVLSEYSLYKVVYQYRCFDKSKPFPEDYVSFYRQCLESDYTVFDFDACTIKLCLMRLNGFEDFLYSDRFKPYSEVFVFLDQLNQCYDNIVSENKKKEFSEKSEFQKRHSAARFNSQNFNFYDSIPLDFQSELDSFNSSDL